jgi:hypothetical protein
MTIYVDKAGTAYLPPMQTQADFEEAAIYLSHPDLFDGYSTADVTPGKDDEDPEDDFSESMSLGFTRFDNGNYDNFQVYGKVTDLPSALDLCAKLLTAAGFSINRLVAEVGPTSDGRFVYHTSTV